MELQAGTNLTKQTFGKLVNLQVGWMNLEHNFTRQLWKEKSSLKLAPPNSTTWRIFLLENFKIREHRSHILWIIKNIDLMLSQLEALLTKDTCVGKLLKLKANEVSKRLFLVETMKMMKNIRLRLVCLITFYTVRVGRREDWLTTSATSRRVPFTPIV